MTRARAKWLQRMTVFAAPAGEIILFTVPFCANHLLRNN